MTLNYWQNSDAGVNITFIKVRQEVVNGGSLVNVDIGIFMRSNIS